MKAKRAAKPKTAASAAGKLKSRRFCWKATSPPPPSASGPGQKYALGPVPPPQHFEPAEAELPEAYGTRRLFLTARDPHWLYAYWDLTREQQSKFNAKSSDGHLILRIYPGKLEGHPVCEIHVHPESRHWFAHVERAGDSYAAELGYYSPVGRWARIAVSSATVTPPDTAAAEGEVEFATIPFEFPFARLIEIIKSAVGENLPLAQAVEELRRHGHPDLPRADGTPVSTWTAQQEQALAQVVNIDEGRRIWMGSLEITELIRRRLAQEISSLGISSLSSPFGGLEQPKGFWFNVNAELIIYGATEPAPGSRSADMKSNCVPMARSATVLRCRTGNMTAGGRRFRRRHGRARGQSEIQPRDRISWRCRRASAGSGALTTAAGKCLNPWTHRPGEP